MSSDIHPDEIENRPRSRVLAINDQPVARVASFPRRIGKVYDDGHDAARLERAKAKRDRKAAAKLARQAVVA